MSETTRTHTPGKQPGKQLDCDILIKREILRRKVRYSL